MLIEVKDISGAKIAARSRRFLSIVTPFCDGTELNFWRLEIDAFALLRSPQDRHIASARAQYCGLQGRKWMVNALKFNQLEEVFLDLQGCFQLKAAVWNAGVCMRLVT